MRLSHLLLAATAGHTTAQLLGEAPMGRGAPVQLPRETNALGYDGANGWTPRPTDGPELGYGTNALERARRRAEWMKGKRQTENTWINDETCGWTAGISSAPFTCEDGEVCSSRENVVACYNASATYDAFFTACLDRDASLKGFCESMGTKTGCCGGSAAGSCITYVWPGSSNAAPLSMFRCWSQQLYVTMLTEPQYIIDERTKTTSTTESSTSSTTTTSETTAAQTTTDAPPPEESKNNTGAIVGGVVGGVAGISLIAGLIAFLVIRKRNKDKAAVSPQGYSAVAPADSAYGGGGASTGYPPGVSPPMSHAGYFPQGSVGPGTPYMAGTPPPGAPGMYDQRQSYYSGAPKIGDQVPGGYAPYPGGPPGQYGAPGGQFVSELDTTTAAAGQQSNPVEMPANSPTQK